MIEGKRFSFTERRNNLGVSSSMPYLPLTLMRNNLSVQVMGLLDTGASVNVLPYDIGLQRLCSLGRTNNFSYTDWKFSWFPSTRVSIDCCS